MRTQVVVAIQVEASAKRDKRELPLLSIEDTVHCDVVSEQRVALPLRKLRI